MCGLHTGFCGLPWVSEVGGRKVRAHQSKVGTVGSGRTGNLLKGGVHQDVGRRDTVWRRADRSLT